MNGAKNAAFQKRNKEGNSHLPKQHLQYSMHSESRYPKWEGKPEQSHQNNIQESDNILRMYKCATMRKWWLGTSGPFLSYRYLTSHNRQPVQINMLSTKQPICTVLN